MKRTIAELANNVEYKPLKDALFDKISGKITQAELTGICYRWSVEYALEQMAHKAPPMTPMCVLQFYKKTDKAKKAILENSDARRELDAFWNEESKIKSQNGSNKVFLTGMLKYFEKHNEQDKAGRVREVLNGY